MYHFDLYCSATMPWQLPKIQKQLEGLLHYTAGLVDATRPSYVKEEPANSQQAVRYQQSEPASSKPVNYRPDGYNQYNSRTQDGSYQGGRFQV